MEVNRDYDAAPKRVVRGPVKPTGKYGHSEVMSARRGVQPILPKTEKKA